MIIFQILFVPLLLALLFRDVTAICTCSGNRMPRAARVVCWLVAAVLVSMPHLASDLAAMVGIGRGADLVMYVFLLVAPIAWFQLQTQNYKLERKLVALARTEALRGAAYGLLSTTEVSSEEDRR